VIVVGLTGGIGSGKSTVSAALAGRGAEIVDADAITRSVQRRGTPVFEAIVERFGPEVVGADGELDRPRLAGIVFADAEAKTDLEAIVHPAVGEGMVRRLGELADTEAVVVLDVPLLVESGRSDELLASLGLTRRGLIVVDTSPVVALERLVEHRGMDEADVRSRMAAQASREERLARADFVIDNNGTVGDLDGEIDRCWTWLEGLRGGSDGPDGG
jgi:dephospho-CoA kinase